MLWLPRAQPLQNLAKSCLQLQALGPASVIACPPPEQDKGSDPKIMEIAPKTKVLVISSLTADGAESTVKALSLGAADTMLKPRPGGFEATC